ncbi:MAG: LysR family transcriptional regulator [Clostridiales bacterium]|nr:LysR family transcriptional regulator [Clostridiales bacterium]
MNLNQLEYFCTAVRCQSITKAANKLYVSQPAISGAIRELEKEFSISLFSHTRNKLVLTDEGRRFYERSELLLKDVETAKLQLCDLGSSRTPVCVGIPPIWGTTFFPDLLRDFKEKYPDIRLTFYEYGSARAAALVKEGELDVALVNLSLNDPDKFHSVFIGRDHFVAAVAPDHHLAHRDSITLEELAAEPLVMYNTDSVQNNSIRSRFDRIGIVPNILAYTSQIYTMKSMIHNNTCVSFFYASLLPNHPDLVGIPIEPRIEQKAGLIWRKEKYVTSSTESFISFVRDYPLFPEEP